MAGEGYKGPATTAIHLLGESMDARKLLVGLVVGAMAGCSSAAATPYSEPTPSSLSRNETCAREAVVATSWSYYHQGTGNTELLTAIGTGKVYYITIYLISYFDQYVFTYGIKDAIPMIESQARTLCTKNVDPVLTSGQLDSLKSLVSTGEYLSDITIFA